MRVRKCESERRIVYLSTEQRNIRLPHRIHFYAIYSICLDHTQHTLLFTLSHFLFLRFASFAVEPSFGDDGFFFSCVHTTFNQFSSAVHTSMQCEQTVLDSLIQFIWQTTQLHGATHPTTNNHHHHHDRTDHIFAFIMNRVIATRTIRTVFLFICAICL